MLPAGTARCGASDQSCVQVGIVSPATLSKVLAMGCLLGYCAKKRKGSIYYILEIKSSQVSHVPAIFCLPVESVFSMHQFWFPQYLFFFFSSF